MTEPRRWHIDLPGTREDEFPWRVHVQEFGSGGPATAILAGMIGDKPLGVLAMHELAARLSRRAVKGTVLILPVVNPFGFQGATRHNPDLVELNRRFPGSAAGRGLRPARPCAVHRPEGSRGLHHRRAFRHAGPRHRIRL